MRIVIVGDGKIGSALAEQLSREGHEITIVDRSGTPLQRTVEDLDILSVEGNGATYATQIEAGTQHNVVPDTCRFVVDVRTTDAYSNEETVGILQAALRSDAVPRSTRIRAAAVGGEHPLVKAAVAAGRETYVSPTTSDRTLMPFPALKMGPGQSSRSHTADEFVLLEEIAEGIAVYEKYIGKLAQEYGWKTLG